MIPHDATLILSASAILRKLHSSGCLPGSGWVSIWGKQSYTLVRARRIQLARSAGFVTGSSPKWTRPGISVRSFSHRPSVYDRGRNGPIPSWRFFTVWMLRQFGYWEPGLREIFGVSISTITGRTSLSLMIYSPTKTEQRLSNGKRLPSLSWVVLKGPWRPPQKAQTPNWSCSTPRKRSTMWSMLQRKTLNFALYDILVGPRRHLAWMLVNRYLAGKRATQPICGGPRSELQSLLIDSVFSRRKRRCELSVRKQRPSGRSGFVSMMSRPRPVKPCWPLIRLLPRQSGWTRNKSQRKITKS